MGQSQSSVDGDSPARRRRASFQGATPTRDTAERGTGRERRYYGSFQGSGPSSPNNINLLEGRDVNPMRASMSSASSRQHRAGGPRQSPPDATEENDAAGRRQTMPLKPFMQRHPCKPSGLLAGHFLLFLLCSDFSNQ